ncbi:MAG: ABC transporter ATP-binding protein [Candidatus Heimdallarchaeota archaeon]|nr:MAG: ABC transporter ATP-binding protein [Candidatus Heimdallarchaeota archaeon]
MHVVKRLLLYILQRKRLALAVIFFVCIAQIAELAIPLLVGLTIDQILEADQFAIELVLAGVIIIVITSIVRAITYFLARWLGYIQGERILFSIRSDLFEKFETSSLEFHDQHHTGDLMARATTDLEPISEMLVWGERIFLQAGLTYLGIYLVLFLIDLQLFLLMGVITPLLFIIAYFISTRLGPLFFEIRTQYGRLTTVIQENISGMQIVKAFNAEDREKQKFDKENLGYFDLRAYAFKIRSIFIPMFMLIINLLIAILIFSGGWLVIEGDVSTGLLVALLTYFTMLVMPTRFLAYSLVMYQRVNAAGDRVFTLLDSPTILPESSIPQKLPDDVTPTIIFDNVSFSYGSRKTLSDVSMTINPGEKIAILGPTGSGKSTIISMIPRFYDPTEGKILVKTGQKSYDIRDLDIKSWRKKVGYVHQEPFLFGRTISENIAFGVTETERIDEVVKIAQLDEFTKSLPDGLDTLIGERGVTLSGGQKQRVAIARMLLRRNPIMILDDATSSLDIATEAEFQRAFTQFLTKSKHTVIFITQRLSTVKLADRIVILNRGQIVEQGTHEDLLEKGEIYPLLWKTQEGGMLDIRLALEKIIQERS